MGWLEPSDARRVGHRVSRSALPRDSWPVGLISLRFVLPWYQCS